MLDVAYNLNITCHLFCYALSFLINLTLDCVIFYVQYAVILILFNFILLFLLCFV